MDDAEFTKLLDEKIRRQLGAPSETELIEILNRYEYQLELEQNSSAISKYGDAGAECIRQVVLIREHLARRQGGKLDRFGLRDMSVVEMEHRRQEVEGAVQQLESQVAARVKPRPVSAGLFAGLGEMLAGPDPLLYQLFVKRKLLSEIALQIKLRLDVPPPRTLSVAEQKQQRTEAALRKMNDLRVALQSALAGLPPDTGEDLKKAIKRTYQTEIDAVRDHEL